MPSLKDLRVRIGSVKNTQKITKTMKMVSAAKVRKARIACEDARPYAEKMYGVLANLTKTTDKTSAPLLFKGRDEVKTVRLVIFGSVRGLCGGFNTGILKATLAEITKHQQAGRTVELVTVGRKARDILKSAYGDLIVERHDNLAGTNSYETAGEFAASQLKAFEDEKCDLIVMIYNKFVSMLTQDPTVQQLAPFSVDTQNEDEENTINAAVEYEPDDDVVLGELLPRNVNMQIFRALLESNASEQAARMTAMDNATRNAGEMIQKLSTVYNRTRQAAITTEMIEIVSGAEAVNG